MMRVVFQVRWLSGIAVVFGALGAALMFGIGAITTLKAVGVYFGSEDDVKAFSSDAALDATVDLVSALDQFLLGLVLLIFAYGIYALFIVADRTKWETQSSVVNAPDWLKVDSVTDLKVKLLEVVAVLLAVLFLKGILTSTENISWPDDLVVPVAVVLFAATVWLIRKAH
jgi:uncharacterized membrane protein YqhA